ncbi:MAG: hypothetical protein PVSMB2_33280 [Ktedonobacteraceae bacterium]
MRTSVSEVENLDAPGVKARPLRILVVATEAPPIRGGIARIVGALRDGFQQQGHHVDVLAYPQIGRIQFREVRLSSLIFKLPQLLRYINTYDVIHVHGATPTVSDVALLLALFCKRRSLVVYTHHMDLDFKPIGFLNTVYNRLHHLLLASVDVVIASTWDNLNLLKRERNNRNVVIPFGIDLTHFRTNGQKDKRFTVLFIGQFRPYKGVHVLLQAMSQVSDTRLILAGQGPEEQEYRALGKELGVDVEFHTHVDDNQLRQLYQRAHAVVLPSTSRLEAFGIVLVEGMAAGCIPVASNLPGVREVVGQAGFLFPVGDASHLAGILRNLRDDPHQIQQISERARVRAATFDRQRVLFDYERLITGLIACRSLKDRLTNRALPYTVALRTLVIDITRILQADCVELLLWLNKHERYLLASDESIEILDHHRLHNVSPLLAKCIDRNDIGVLQDLETNMMSRPNVVVSRQPAMVTPLTLEGVHFGAILLMRKQPFNQYDFRDLIRFAQQAASSLYAVIERAMKEVKR